MVKYKVISTVRLFSGKVLLDSRQAKKRALRLRSAGKGTFEITGPVEFKAGEVVGFAQIPKPYIKSLKKIETSKNDSKQSAVK